MALTQTQAAQIIAVTPRRIRQMHQDGNGPPQNDSGQYEEDAFGDWLRARYETDAGAYNYEAERARLTHEQADKTALENAELRGDLVRSSVVGPYWSEMVASMRTKLVAMPSKLAARVAEVAVRAKFHGQAETLIYEVLAEIEKDGLPRTTRDRIERSALQQAQQQDPHGPTSIDRE